jgi:hypothetical protein
MCIVLKGLLVINFSTVDWNLGLHIIHGLFIGMLFALNVTYISMCFAYANLSIQAPFDKFGTSTLARGMRAQPTRLIANNMPRLMIVRLHTNTISTYGPEV